MAASDADDYWLRVVLNIGSEWLEISCADGMRVSLGGAAGKADGVRAVVRRGDCVCSRRAGRVVLRRGCWRIWSIYGRRSGHRGIDPSLRNSSVRSVLLRVAHAVSYTPHSVVAHNNVVALLI